MSQKTEVQIKRGDKTLLTQGITKNQETLFFHWMLSPLSSITSRKHIFFILNYPFLLILETWPILNYQSPNMLFSVSFFSFTPTSTLHYGLIQY